MKIKNKQRLLKQLETITDFRTDRHKIEYVLSEVLFISLFGLLKGYVNKTDRRYIAKVKGNQEGLRDKAKETINIFKSLNLNNSRANSNT